MFKVAELGNKPPAPAKKMSEMDEMDEMDEQEQIASLMKRRAAAALEGDTEEVTSPKDCSPARRRR